MNKYENGKIYKIIGENQLPYIGSTTETLEKRLIRHNAHYNYYYKHNGSKSKYMGSFTLVKCIDCKIELIENYPCNSKRDLEIRERYWYDIIENCNLKKPYISKEETAYNNKTYYENNKEYVLKLQKEYSKTRLDHIHNQKNKPYICGCGLTYTHSNRTRHFKTKTHLAYLSTLSSSTP